MDWKHQRDEVLDHGLMPGRALLWSPRSGKTRAAVESMRLAWKELKHKKFVVIAPQLAARTTWSEELEENFPEALVIQCAGGPVFRRASVILDAAASKSETPKVVLVNWEALSKLKDTILAFAPHGVVADEAHYAKRAGAKRSRALWSLGVAPWRRILTGTLTPNNYTDVYSQWKFLNKSRFGTSKAAFWDRYVITNPRYPQQVVGYAHLEELQAYVAMDASVVDRRTVLGTPHELDVPVSCLLDEKWKRKYHELSKLHSLEGQDYPHRLARMQALQQFTSGFQNVDGQPVWLHDTKIKALAEEVERFRESGEQLVIFFQYTVEGERIRQKLQEMGITSSIVNGATAINARITTRSEFQSGRLPVVLWQEATDTQGISLSAADACIFYSHSFNYANVKQARDRIWKPSGMLRYIYLRTPGTIDDFAWRIIETKGEASETFLDAVS